MNTATSPQTAQTKYHHQVHLHNTEIIILAQDTVLDPHLTIIIGTDTGLTGQDHIPTVTDTEATARVYHRQVTPGHITDVTQKCILPQTLKHISPPTGYTT